MDARMKQENLYREYRGLKESLFSAYNILSGVYYHAPAEISSDFFIKMSELLGMLGDANRTLDAWCEQEELKEDCGEL